MLSIINNQKEKISKSFKWFLKRYNKCKPRHQYALGEALKKYVSAFDERNKYICFLKAWTVLEILTNTDQNDQLISRCTALFDDNNRLYEKQVLESLRLYRNELVHQGDEGHDPLFACFTLQSYIYHLIVRFNLYMSGSFQNIEEANLFLDSYIPNIKDMTRRKRILDIAIDAKLKNTRR